MRIQEEAAARCKCSRNKRRKPERNSWLTAVWHTRKKKKVKSELHVDGKFTEEREGRREELQRHCEEVYTDQDETRERARKIIQYLKKKGGRALYG